MPPLPALIFTLCFLTRGNQVLLLQRDRPPNQALWNGVGGHIEPGETPLQSCLREVEEETGYRLDTAQFAGVLTWEGFEMEAGGLYLFTASAPPGEPRRCSEGALEWKAITWAKTHPAVVSNLHVVLPYILNSAQPQVYHFTYQDQQMLRHDIYPLPADWKGHTGG